MNESTPEDFLHHFYDTAILLGCRKEIADLLKKAQDCHVTKEDVDALRNYNIGLIGGVKTRLVNLNALKIRVAKPPSGESEK